MNFLRRLFGGKPKWQYFEISVQRFCGEFVCGHVSREFYDYWQDPSGDISLEEHVHAFGDPDEGDPNSPSVKAGDTDEPEGWYGVYDIIHASNAVTHSNYIHVEEVTPDAESYTGYTFLPDSYSGSFEFDALEHDWCETTREIEVEQDVEEPTTPVLVCKSIEKGAQTVVFAKTRGPFDITKLKFTLSDIDGDHVIDTVYYDDEELENHPDSSEGRAFYAYLGDLATNWTADTDTA